MEKDLYDQIFQIESEHWWYKTRQKIVFDWLSKLIDDYDDPTILDVGCGTGLNIEKIRRQGYEDAVGVDLSFDALDYCRVRNLHNLVCGDATHLPLKGESFDIILALDIIEHLDDDTQAIDEFNRLLKSRGVLIIFTPAFGFLWGLQDIISHHRRRYEYTELKEKLTRAGLRAVKLSYVNTFLFPMIWAGRVLLKKIGYQRLGNISENDITPGWSNGLLEMVFSAELPLIRRINLPFGVSLFAIFRK